MLRSARIALSWCSKRAISTKSAMASPLTLLHDGGIPYIVTAATALSGAKLVNLPLSGKTGYDGVTTNIAAADGTVSTSRGVVLKVNDDNQLFDEVAIAQYLLETSGSETSKRLAASNAQSQQWLAWNRSKLQVFFSNSII